MEHNSASDNNSEEQQNQSEEADTSNRPSLSQVKKSWGFRRTTIARREFLEEVGDLAHSPPLLRRGKSRRISQTPQNSSETRATPKATAATRSVIDDLEWSAPSSPVSDESKPASETFTGGAFDPSLWQDIGSAFHTAFSLLGGNEGLSLEVPNSLVAPVTVEATDSIEPSPQRVIDETDIPENTETTDDMESSQPVAPDIVSGEEIDDDVVLISSREDDSDEMTLLQIKKQIASQSRQVDTRARGVKAGRGKAKRKGRGRGRKKGKGRGRGRGKAVGLHLGVADDEDDDEEEVMIVTPAEQQLREEESTNEPQCPIEIETSPAHSVTSLSPAHQSSSDCICIESDLDHTTDTTLGQYEDAPEKQEEQERKDRTHEGKQQGQLDFKGYDSEALCCICQQKRNNRFMICCNSCQGWFHGSCVGTDVTEGAKMEKRMQEYICPPCTRRKQDPLLPEPQPEPGLSSPVCLTQSPSCEEVEGRDQQQTLKESEVLLEEKEEKEAPESRFEPEPKAEMKTDGCFPLCIGPGCSKKALPDSVYCGTDCILQHAAFTMKTLTVSKVPKSKGRAQKKDASARPTAKVLRSSRMSKRLAGKAEEEEEEEEKVEVKEDVGGQMEAAPSSVCDPTLTEVQTTSPPSSQFCTASKEDSKQVEADTEDVTPSEDVTAEDSSTHAPTSQPAVETATSKSLSPETEPLSSRVSNQESADSKSLVPPTPETTSLPSATHTLAPRHHETGALMVTKTTYVIPKKQSVPQTVSSQVPASASFQKPPPTQTLLNETRNLLVPPAPSAPSSRPSQPPNNQVRQSIQRSLTSILYKRVCDCEDLEMTESDAAKLVASIEMEMFDIFRNTDSKYMNKYRTIMFNLKDTRNKGLLYSFVRGEISPFRLARMSQKDMQAIKASEPSSKETPEVNVAAAKTPSLLSKPEAVKVDLPPLNVTRPGRNAEQKKSLPAPPLKTKTNQKGHGSALPDVLTCMLKDTTSEHKTHLFDLKCKICTGQIAGNEEEEPAKKKAKVSETRDKHEPAWKKSSGADSPLQAPPDSPDIESPTSSLIDPSSRLIIDSPVLTIVESPASPITDSPASPVQESPASPVMDSPASPAPSIPKASSAQRTYAPVVIPAASTATFTRRDPRTAANRSSGPSSGSSGPINTVAYAPLKETQSALPSASAPLQPQIKTVPKSILMKPSSSVESRLYGTSSRAVISNSSTEDETTQFLAKQEIVWKGFLNMLTVAKFVTKGYLVSGSAENLKTDLPDTIQIGGRIMPETVWDYVAKLKTSVTKELCVIRFHPATEEEEVAYVSLFSYFSSRGRFGVVANGSRLIKDLYLVPLSAKESIPSILQPLEGPGLETKRPNLLLGLAIIQKSKRPGSFPQEVDEKRPKVNLSKDPMWIPKPPVLYGSDNLEIFQPYDPETPTNTSPPDSPSCPGSPSESSCSGSITIPSVLTSVTVKPPVSSSATAVSAQATSNRIPDQNPTASGEKTPLQTILNSLFSNKKTVSLIPTDGTSAKTTGSVNTPACSPVSGPMMDPIVQQYGQKLKVKEVQEEENDLDRPYDPEEEYPAIGYKKVDSQSIEKNEASALAMSCSVDDDVAYDPEDETIFADIQGSTDTKPHIQTQISDSSGGSTPISTQAVTLPSASTSMHTSTEVIQNLPMGTVVVSAATLTEQQRMLEELNKQIEEQKRQLKEQEEALRQQREAVGMFMAHFSVSDSLMSPPQKSLPLSQLSSLQGGVAQTESKTSQLTDKASSPAETVDTSNLTSQSVKVDDSTTISNLNNDTNNVEENEEAQKNLKESDRYSSAGEIEDSDVAYDPEDESLFNEIFEDVFQGCSKNTCDSSLSRTGRSASHRGASQSSYHSKKRRQSPKRRSRREKDRHRSPSRRSHRHSPSHSQRRRGRDRHRKSERDRSRHRTKDNLVQQGRHRRDHTGRRHSHGHRGSPSSLRQKDSESLSPKHHRRSSPNLLGKSSLVSNKNDCDENNLACNLVESLDENSSAYSCELLQNVKLEISEPSSEDQQKPPVSDHDNKAKDNNTQVDKYSPQASLIESKIDSAIPLREIDPPIRDSPQSPDPEPQFAKPSSIEKNDHVKMEKIQDPLSIACSLDEGDTKCLPIGGQTTLTRITWPSLGESGPDIRNLDFIALDLQGSDSKTQSIIKVEKKIKDEDEQSQDFSSLQKDLLCLKREEHSSQPENPNSQPGVTSTGESGGPQIQKEQKTSEIGKDSTQNNTGQNLDSGGMSAAMTGTFVRDLSTDQWQLMQNNCQSLNQGPLPRHGRDANMGSEGFGRERSLDSNKCTGLDGTGPRGDTLDRQGPQCGVEVQITRPGSNRNFENRGEMSVHTPDMMPSESMHELRRPDFTESSYMGHGQYMGGPHARADRDDTLTINSRGEIVERDPNKRNRGFQGSNKQGQQQVRSEQIGQEEITIPNITNQNWDGAGSGLVGPNERSQASQNTGLGAHSKEPDWHVQGSKVQDDWRGPEWRESDPVRVGPHIQDQWRVYQADRRGPNTEDMRRGRKGSEGPDFMASEPGRRGIDTDVPVQGRRRPEGPDFTKQGPERTGPDFDALMHDRRGPGVPDFRRLESERRTPINDNQGLGMREPRGPDFVGSGFERRGPTVECPGLNRRPPTGPNFKKPWLENRGPDMDPSVTDRKGLQLPNFNEPRHEGKGLFRKDSRPAARETGDSNFIVPGPYRRGNGGPEYMGRETDSRDLSVEGPKSGAGRQDFREPGLCRRGMSFGGLGADEGNLGGPDFREPGYDRKVPPMGELEPDWKGPGCRDFRGPGPDFVGTPLRGRGLERGRPGGPDFVGPGTDRRVPVMAGLRPDRIGPGGPDFREPEPTRRSPVTDLGVERNESELSWPVHETCYTTKSQGGSDFHGQELKSRDRAMVGPGPNNRRQSSPDSRGCNRRDSSMQSQGPNRRGPGDQNTCALGPRSHTRGHEGTHLCGSEPESEHQYINNPGTKRRGPPFRGLRPGGQDSVMEVSGPNRKGPGGPHIGPRGFQHSGPNMEGTALEIRDLEAHNFRGPEKRQTEIDGIGRGRGFPERPPFRFSMSDRRPSEINGQESDTRGPHLRVRPDTTAIDGPIADRGLRGPDFRGSSCEGRGPDFRGPGTDRYEGGTRYREPGAERRGPDIEGPETNWRRSGDFGQGNRQKGLNKRGQRPRKDQWEGSAFGGSEPTQGSLDPEGLGEDTTGQSLRGSGPIRRHNRGPGPDMSILDQEDRWKRADFRSSTPDRRSAYTDDQWFDERGPEIERPKPFFEGPGEHFQERSRQAAPLDWREPDNRGPKAIQERPNMRGRGPGDDWGGSNFKGPEPFRNDPDMECPGPSGRRLGNKWKEPNREVGEPSRFGPGQFFKGLRDAENVGQCRDSRGPGIRGPGSDIKTGIDNVWRGPDMRRRGPNKTDDQSVNHGPGRWDTITDCPGLDSSEPAPPYFDSPHQVVKFQGPSDPHSAPVSGPQGPTQNSGENICQQTLKPQRHRGALLPTPTGVIRFPNRTVNNPDFFSRNRKQIGHS